MPICAATGLRRFFFPCFLASAEMVIMSRAVFMQRRMLRTAGITSLIMGSTEGPRTITNTLNLTEWEHRDFSVSRHDAVTFVASSR